MRNIVENVNVYGLDESVKASKYPFAIDTDDCNSDITKTVLNLASSPKGSGEDTFLDGIIVQFDLTFSKQAWPEFQRYHFADFVSSQSTMHRITQFNVEEQCNEWVTPEAIANLSNCVKEYEKTKSEDSFRKVIYNVPSGFTLTARITTNYRQLKTMYSQRKTHRLPEWREFCKWIETLPHSELIVGNK